MAKLQGFFENLWCSKSMLMLFNVCFVVSAIARYKQTLLEIRFVFIVYRLGIYNNWLMDGNVFV